METAKMSHLPILGDEPHYIFPSPASLVMFTEIKISNEGQKSVNTAWLIHLHQPSHFFYSNEQHNLCVSSDIEISEYRIQETQSYEYTRAAIIFALEKLCRAVQICTRSTQDCIAIYTTNNLFYQCHELESSSRSGRLPTLNHRALRHIFIN